MQNFTKKPNLIRVSKADSLPLKKATFYKWHHIGKHPNIFVRLGRAVFIDIDELYTVIEKSRIKG